MNSNPVAWFEIYVQDMKRAKQFYESVFQTTLQELKSPVSGIEMWQFTSDQNSYGVSGALAKMQGVSSGDSGTIVYFACKDCAVEQARVTQAGGRVEKPKMSIGQYGFISLVYDTEGNMIGLHSMQS